MKKNLNPVLRTGIRCNLRYINTSQVCAYMYVTPSTILELGAGLTGLLGIGLSASGLCTSVHTTDGHPLCVANIEACIQCNRELLGSGFVPPTTSRLRWLTNDPYQELSNALSFNNGNRFHTVVAADCLFFKDFHQDLLWMINECLADVESSRCYLLQPKRSGSMQKFLDLVVEGSIFEYECCEDYCRAISSMHEEYTKNNDDGTYNEDVHFPILVILKRKVIARTVNDGTEFVIGATDMIESESRQEDARLSLVEGFLAKHIRAEYP